MTRILHITRTADPRSGGPIEGAIRLGEVWRREGHTQDLLTIDPPDAPFLGETEDRTIALGNERWPARRLRYGFAPEMIGWIRRHAHEYDAAIVSGLWNFSVLGARLALPRLDLPYFVYTHGMLDPWFKHTYPLKNMGKQLSWLLNEGALLRHAQGVLFTTEEERLLAEDAFFPYKVRPYVVGYGTADIPGDAETQIAAFRATVPAVTGRRYLLFLSRIHEKKGCDLLIDGFAGIAARDPDLDLVIAGPDDVGLAKELASQAARLGLAERVHFPGMLRGEAKWGAYRACEAFALTSHQENFGVVVAEAMAAGRPVLISDKVNIWREVTADGAGLVESDTAEGARRLLERFITLSAGARAAMGAAGRASFLRRYTAEAAADTLMRLIEGAIGGQGRRRAG